MKRRFVFAIIFILSNLAFGQETKIIKTSLSVLGTGVYNDGKYDGSNVDLRIAQEIQTKFYDGGSFSTRAGYTAKKGFITFWFDQALSKTTSLRVGYSGRPIAFLNRPHPASATAHFETSATALIPGSAGNIMLTHKTGDVTLYQGVYYNQIEKLTEVNLGSSWKSANGVELKGGAFWNEKQYGFAGTFKNELVLLTAYHESKAITSCSVEMYTAIVDPYAYIVYDRTTRKETDCEIGFTKTFSLSQYADGLNYVVGAAYNTTSKSAIFYLWIYIER